MNLGKLVTKPIVAILILVGIILIWIGLLILTFGDLGNVSLMDFGRFLRFSGVGLMALVAFIAGMTSTNFEGYERVGFLVAAGFLAAAFAGL